MKKNIKSVLLLLPVFVGISCQSKMVTNQAGMNLGRFSSQPVIEDYLNQQVADTGFGGNAYCAYEVLDVEKSGRGENLYLWTVCQEYYRKNQKLESGTGSSFPVALTISQQNEKIEILSHQKPRDGSYYATDLKAMFSDTALAAADLVNNQRVAKLQNAVKQAAGVP